MERTEYWKKELEKLEEGKSEFVWDEIEELITDEFDDGKLSSEEFDELMAILMDIEC